MAQSYSIQGQKEQSLWRETDWEKIIFLKTFGIKKTLLVYLQPLKRRAHNSVGSEWLPYKQQVGGSSPSVPTLILEES